MKQTDLNEIQAEAREMIAQFGSGLLDFLTLEEAVNCLVMIYVTNDVTAGFAQDYTNNISVISSPHRVAIIYQGHHSFYKSQPTLCGYEDLEEDLNYVRICVDAALSRWEENNDAV